MFIQYPRHILNSEPLYFSSLPEIVCSKEFHVSLTCYIQISLLACVTDIDSPTLLSVIFCSSYNMIYYFSFVILIIVIPSH